MGGPTTFSPDGYFSSLERFSHFPEHEVPKGLDWIYGKVPQLIVLLIMNMPPKSWRTFYDFGSGKQWPTGVVITLDRSFWALDLGMPNITVDAVIPNPESSGSYYDCKGINDNLAIWKLVV